MEQVTLKSGLNYIINDRHTYFLVDEWPNIPSPYIFIQDFNALSVFLMPQ